MKIILKHFWLGNWKRIYFLMSIKIFIFKGLKIREQQYPRSKRNQQEIFVYFNSMLLLAFIFIFFQKKIILILKENLI